MLFINKRIVQIFMVMALSTLIASSAVCADIQVPGDYATIQEAIDNSTYGDTVKVSPGLYQERIIIEAGITVEGAGRDVTFLDGGGKCAIVWIQGSARTYNTVFRGFTIQNGNDGTYSTDEGSESGIYIDYPGSATIEDNVINSNRNHGIWVSDSYADTVIRRNIIHGSTRYGIGNYTGDPIIENNIIYNNTWSGIQCWNSVSQPTIRNNTIVNNVGQGVVFGNGSTPKVFENNIIAFNGEMGIYMYTHSSLTFPLTFYYNAVYGNQNPHNENIALDGNTSVLEDPLFTDPAALDYTLLPGSPCMDAGNPGSQFNDTDGSRNDLGASGGTGSYSGDMEPPEVTGHSPAENALNQASLPIVEVNISDTDSGVDLQTIVIDINGSRIFDGNNQAAYPDAALSGSAAQYTVTYTPSAPYASGEKVSVYVNCKDLQSNIMAQYGFSFFIEPYDPITYRVPDEFSSIQAAIDSTRFGDTVLVGVGLFNGSVILKEGVHLKGSGPYLSTITGYGSIIRAKDYCTIEGFSILSRYSYGVYCSEVSPVIRHNLFVSDVDSGTNAAIYATLNSNPEIINNTIAGFYNGVIISLSSSALLSNNIITSSRSNGIHNDDRSGIYPVLEYNNVYGNAVNYTGCTPGSGGISVDPEFMDEAAGKYSLMTTSSCIDAGNPDIEYNDIDGSRNDMGAFGGPDQVCNNSAALAAFAASFGSVGCTACQGDMDADQTVDGTDLAELADIFSFIPCSF